MNVGTREAGFYEEEKVLEKWSNTRVVSNKYVEVCRILIKNITCGKFFFSSVIKDLAILV